MNSKTVVMVFATLLASSPVVSAANSPNWQFEVTPYAWLTGVEGDAKVASHHADFDKSFSDIVSKVDVTGSLLAVAKKDWFVAWVQGDYFDLSTSSIQVPGTYASAKFEMKLTVAEGAVGCQIPGWSEGQTFDLLVGMRHTTLDNTLTIKPVDRWNKTITLNDPMLIVRPSMPILPSKVSGLRFNPTLGIGAGGDSKYVWEMQPQIQYQFTDHLAGRFGYRRMAYKCEESDPSNYVNLRMAGLIVGLGVTW